MEVFGGFVNVCDLNMPWLTHKVTSNKGTITALKWDLAGEKLVVANSIGLVELWT